MHVGAPPFRTRWWQNTAQDAKVKNNKGTNRAEHEQNVKRLPVSLMIEKFYRGTEHLN